MYGAKRGAQLIRGRLVEPLVPVCCLKVVPGGLVEPAAPGTLSGVELDRAGTRSVAICGGARQSVNEESLELARERDWREEQGGGGPAAP